MTKKAATGGLAPKEKAGNRYSAIIREIFFSHYKPKIASFEFDRDEIKTTADKLGIKLPDNIGDTIYSFRFRTQLPEEIAATAPTGKEWDIELAGRGKYRFKLGKISRIVPGAGHVAIKIPDSTPEIIEAYALSDEQALLAKVRYNRLIDIFLGLTTYSLQNHLRTTVKKVGQIEIDEVYVGINSHGHQFVIPVQAKGGSDTLGSTQTKQDVACCREKFPGLTCRPVSAQFMAEDVIALFELAIEDDEVKVYDEKHYRLVASDSIQPEELRQCANR